MIKNLWKCTNFWCSHRHQPEKMTLIQGPMSLFYACPKYYPENREEDERACTMRLNLVDAEAILEKLSKIIEEDDNNNINADYTNLEFDYKAIHVTVISYDKTGIINLNIYNKKAIR